MKPIIKGIVPVMLTPFTNAGVVDYPGLAALTEWYLDAGVDALFAVCQSSEMQFLTLHERVGIARAVVDQVNGRVPVVASGHVSDSEDMQVQEMAAMAECGVDAIILVSNRIDPRNEGFATFKTNLQTLIARLPGDVPLGLYECPVPYRRLLSDDEIKLCRDTGRFAVLKDVSCNLETVRRRAQIVEGSGFHIINANAAIAFAAMQSGSNGFAGVFTNVHPDLYVWLYKNRNMDNPVLPDLVTFLALSSCAESMGYPGLAKLFHQRLGTFGSAFSRATNYDLNERHWAASEVLDHIDGGNVRFRKEIGAAGF
jgi:4-hydroxy-tetrahydrodipicolinate synthase